MRTGLGAPIHTPCQTTDPPRARDLAWRLEALGFDVTSAVVRLFPIEWISALGGWIFKWLGPLTPSAKIAERNIDIAFPDLTPKARAQLLRDQWDNLGRTFFEFPLTDRLTPARGEWRWWGASGW